MSESGKLVARFQHLQGFGDVVSEACSDVLTCEIGEVFRELCMIVVAGTNSGTVERLSCSIARQRLAPVHLVY